MSKSTKRTHCTVLNRSEQPKERQDMIHTHACWRCMLHVKSNKISGTTNICIIFTVISVMVVELEPYQVGQHV
jgi:hypothetical protein